MAHKIGYKAQEMSKIAEIAVLVVVLGLTTAFYSSQTFENSVTVETEKVGPTIVVEKIEVTKQDLKVIKPVGVKIPIPTAGSDDEATSTLAELGIDDNTDFKVAAAPPPAPVFSGKEAEEEAIDFYAVQEKPEVLGNGIGKFLKYPEAAKKGGIEGKAIMKFICSKEGFPVNIEIMSEDPKDFGFGEAAKLALQQVRFKPGIQRDKPVPVAMKLPVMFTLKKRN